jgi:hypothetical protein
VSPANIETNHKAKRLLFIAGEFACFGAQDRLASKPSKRPESIPPVQYATFIEYDGRQQPICFNAVDQLLKLLALDHREEF